jgi:F420-dependent oxidoreductase-like protein
LISGDSLDGTMGRIRFGVKTSQARDYGDYDALRRVWLEADRLGFHSGWLFDHLFELPGAGPSLEPCLEAWTCLSALATETKMLRLGVTVLCNNYRNPAILAKMASTLDVISGGRLEFGIGSGWASVEHEAYGIPFEKPATRVRKLREAIRIIRLMWSEEKATYHGKYFSVDGAVNNPKPLQRPHPTIWVGGGGEGLTLRAIAELADGCNFISLSPEEYAHKLVVLQAHCEHYARDPGEIQRSWQGRILLAKDAGELREKQRRLNIDSSHNIVGTPEECVKRIGKYTDLGVSLFMLVFPEATRSTGEMELFMDSVAPSFE